MGMGLAELTGIEQWRHAAATAGQLAGQLAQINADLVEFTAELIDSEAWAGDGIASPEHWLQVMCALSPAHSRDIVTIARRHADFPELMQQFHQGQVSADQMAVVARHVPANYSADMAGFVPQATVNQLRRVLPRYHFPEAPEPVEEPARPDIHRDDPKLSMWTTNGRFRLEFEADPLDGALVEQAIREAKDALFTAGNDKVTLADALIEACSRSLKATEVTSRRDHYKVLVHLDADGNGWTNKKGALPAHLLQRLTCNGTLRPIWERDATPVSVGRAQRIVPNRTRALIEDRDRGCRYPGCPVTGFLENHHLTHWAAGGTTDINSLISLCPRHHREHHQNLYTITGNPATPAGLTFHNRWGGTITTHIPQPIPPPGHPPPHPQPTRGWELETAAVHFTPNPVPAGV